ncbi:MAG: endonuclease domain-containing protein [Ruminococcus sp.]|nr:endonuclease domain-containing protein [Ruminococcus sp.]
MTNISRTLRREATKEENHLWYDFLRNHEYKFTRQRIIDNYILDFYCAKIKLAIEIDGSQHYDEEGLIKDTERTAILNKYGISVLRFTNREINDKFEAVCEYINEFIKRKSGTVVNDSVLNRF